MNCIDMNAWYSRIDKPERPDYVVFDLDPPESRNGFAQAIEVAHLVREALEALELQSYVKTSGADGIHVLAADRSPLLVSRDLRARRARLAALEAEHPGLVTTEWLKKKRRGVLVDHRQNGHGKTIASAYSVRPKPGAPVSTPLRWEELGEKVRPRDFGRREALARVEKHGDLFEPVLRGGQALGPALAAPPRGVSRAVVIGSGPNGLAAAIALLQGGLEVEVQEAADWVGGGLHSAELTLPGFVHDVCASVHAARAGLAVLPDARARRRVGAPGRARGASARRRQRGRAGARARRDGGGARVGRGGVPPARRAAGRGVGRARACAARAVSAAAAAAACAPLGGGLRAVRTAARAALGDARSVAESLFADRPGSGLVRGPLRPFDASARASAERGFRPRLGRAGPRGRLAASPRRLAVARRRARRTCARARRLDPHRAAVDELPRPSSCSRTSRRGSSLRLARGRLPDRYEQRPAFASGTARARSRSTGRSTGRSRGARPSAAAQATVHLGGTFDEIVALGVGRLERPVAERPFVLLAQPTPLRPDARARGQAHAWAYCHVPNGSTVDMTDGSRRRSSASRPASASSCSRAARIGPAELEARNRNLVGGDINGGAMDLGQLLPPPGRRARPVPDAARGRLPLLCVDARRDGRRARDVRASPTAVTVATRGRRDSRPWPRSGSRASCVDDLEVRALERGRVCAAASFDQPRSGAPVMYQFAAVVGDDHPVALQRDRSTIRACRGTAARRSSPSGARAAPSAAARRSASELA